MTGRRQRLKWRAAPTLEGLEDRRLLNARIITPAGTEINDQDLARYQVQKANNVPLRDRRIAYTTPQGTKVQLTLFGFGSLAGTKVRPDGALDLVYNKTQVTSKIVGHVSGGNGRAPLASIRDADVPAGSAATAGSDPVNVVNFRKFDLVPGGTVSLTGGVGTLALRSAGRNSQIHVAALPTSATPTSPSTPTSSSTPTGTSTPTGSSTSTPTGSASTPSGGTTGAASPSSSSSSASKPTGVEVSIPVVRGAPRATALGNPQIFGFDPAAGAVVRFDATTGAALQSIPLAASGSPVAGVGLGRNDGRLVALVGSGATITAIDAVSGATVGQFSTASLAANGLSRIDAIGSSDLRTFVADSSAGATGRIQRIDVAQSLRTGQAVAVGAPYTPQRAFELAGGLTGLAGSETIYAAGAARFDPFVPDRLQAGVLAFTPGAAVTTETSRTALKGTNAPFLDAGPPGRAGANPVAALGSIGTNLALVTGVAGGRNVVTLLNPASLAPTGTVALNNPGRLAGLSESFRPELRDAVLVDVRGNLKRFVGREATGLVVSSSGAVNLIKIDRARDTALLGQPLNHVAIRKRQNVTVRSTPRGQSGTTTRGGVTIASAVASTGVLTLP